MATKYFPFEKAIQTGEGMERRIQAWLVEAGAVITEDNCKDGRRDFKCRFKGYDREVEVKCEDRYARTGNICIEVAQGKVPRSSGIMVSQADIWIHTRGDECVLYGRKTMKKAVERWLTAGAKPEVKGDNHNQVFIQNVAALRLSMPNVYEAVTEDLAYSRIWEREL